MYLALLSLPYGTVFGLLNCSPDFSRYVYLHLGIQLLVPLSNIVIKSRDIA